MYKYTIIESLKSKDEIEELDQYVFVHRVRIGEQITIFP